MTAHADRPVKVELLDAEPSGLASMLCALIEGNLQRDPERSAPLRPGVFGLEARDAGVSVTIRTEPGRVRIRDGTVGRPELRIRTDGDALLALSAAPLRLGFPDPFTAEGRLVIRKLLRGDIRVTGLLRHPRRLARLGRLLSTR